MILLQTPHLRDQSNGLFKGGENSDVLMNKLLFRRAAIRLALIVMLPVFASNNFAQSTNGIYAEFNTSMGSYTCRLEYAIAPMACANFIGLATGQRSWLDLPSGVVKTNPFYDGTTFHRVIAGFMNQGGSPNGLGTDGPGYAFVDEFSPSLRHDAFGVLSMANSGPDSNGSQYFITVEPTPWLNDVHTIFGRLYGGSNVVYAINNVATNGNSKPLTNVVVNAINIRRVGTAAATFDISAQGLPVVTNLNLQIAKTGTNVSLTFSNRLYADNRLYASSNLTSWAGAGLGIEITAPVSNSIPRSASAVSQFFRMVQVEYPSSTLAPKNLLGRVLTLNFSGGNGTFIISFNSTGGGTYTWTQGASGTVSYAWQQEPYRGRLSPVAFSAFVPMILRLDFDSSSAGSFSGVAYPNYPFTSGSFSVSGSFTVTS